MTDSLFTRAFLSLSVCLALIGPAFAAEPAPPPDRQQLRKQLEERLTQLLAEPDSVEVHSRRGDHHLFLGRFDEAVREFEKMIALDAALDAPHWRLGIAYYFAGQFGKAARQFEKYHGYEPRDRENGIWKFLSQARVDGVEKARKEMLEYTRFDREPFPALYELFAGRQTSEQVLAELDRKKLTGDGLVMFFAHYYIGLNEELLGRREAAREHVSRAVALFPSQSAAGGPGYMWQVARLHEEALAQPAPAAAEDSK